MSDEGQEAEETVELSEAEVKKAVRERDGHRCRDCGMTSEEHKKKFEKQLEVHRVLPGVKYCLEWCATLCQPCHSKKPRSVDAAVFRDSELKALWFNLYDADDKALYEALKLWASQNGKHFTEAGYIAIRALVADILKHQHQDLFAQADGLW